MSQRLGSQSRHNGWEANHVTTAGKPIMPQRLGSQPCHSDSGWDGWVDRHDLRACPFLISGAPLVPFSIDVVKGWTRMSCVAWVALVLSELDCSDSRVMSQLKPLEKFLDRAWLLPMHASQLDDH